jgi:hypothetical protein
MSQLPVVHSVGMSFGDIERLAVSVAKSGLFGIKTPEQALALMMVSQAEGRHPALAARDYHIIQGTPAKKAEAMQRDFMLAGGKIEWHVLDDAHASATFSHPQGGTVKIDWDMDRAKKAEIRNPMWAKYPRQMLRSRVISEGVRTVFPAATSGMYVPEEVQDFDRPLRDVTPQKSTPRHDPETGEIHEAQFAPGPTVADLEMRFINYAAEGMERLETEWKALTTDQRVALGAGRGTSGPKMAHWKQIAASVKPASQDDLAESPAAAEPLLPPVGDTQTDDEARENIVKQAHACTTIEQIEQLKENWKPRLDKMPDETYNATLAGIGARETELWRASNTAGR